MAGLDIELKDYRDLLGALARRHIRVMGVENREPRAGRAAPAAGRLGRPTVSAAALVEADAPRPRRRRESRARRRAADFDGNVRSGQSIMHPDGDVTIVGRVASGAEIVAGGSVHVYGALQGRVIAGISGSPRAHLLPGGARRTLVHRRRLRRPPKPWTPRFEGRSLEVRLVGEELKLRALD